VLAGIGATILPPATVADEVRDKQFRIEADRLPQSLHPCALRQGQIVPMTNAIRAVSDLVVGRERAVLFRRVEGHVPDRRRRRVDCPIE
jgi:hypothetical protein